MFITENFLNYYLKTSVNLRELSLNLNSSGIINSIKDDAIYVEYPTIRPDCNSVFGVLIEINAIISDDDTLKLTDTINEYTRLFWSRISDESVCFFVGHISESFIKDNINDPVTELMNRNGLYSNSIHELIRNYCALFYGIVIDFLPTQWVQSSSVKDLCQCITIKEQKDGMYHIVFKDKNKTFYANDTSDESSYFFIAPIVNACTIKKSIKRSDILYYYLIRQCNSFFAYRMMTHISDLYYFVPIDSNSCINSGAFDFLLSYDSINRILGTNYSSSTILSVLQKLGYRIVGSNIEVPPWRFDIHNEQDIANDIFRAFFSRDVTFEKGDDRNDDYELYNKIYTLKCSLAYNDYWEIMNRPFISESEAGLLDCFFQGKRQCIRLRNPYDSTKPFFACSNILLCLNAMQLSKHRCFETSVLKYYIDGRYKEHFCLSCAIRLTTSESLCMPINIIWSHTLHSKVCFKVEEVNSFVVWKNPDTSIILCFSANHSKYVDILIELDLNSLLTNNSFHGDFSRQYVDNSMIRDYSIDLPFSISLSEIADVFSKPQFFCIKSVDICSISPFRKNNHWVLNYQFTIKFSGITKKELPNVNRMIINEMRALKGDE